MNRALHRGLVSLAALAVWVSCGTAFAQISLSQRSVVRDPSFQFAKPVKSWREIKTTGIVMQQRDYSCGAAALATLCRFYWGHRINEQMVLDVIEQRLSPEELREREKRGLSMADIEDAAVELGYQATVGKVSFKELTGSKVPVIVVINLGGENHFVVFRGVAAGCVFLADPLRGNLRIAASTFERSWQENALLVVAPPGKTQSDRSQLAIRPAELYRGSLNRQLIRRATSAGF